MRNQSNVFAINAKELCSNNLSRVFGGVNSAGRSMNNIKKKKRNKIIPFSKTPTQPKQL